MHVTNMLPALSRVLLPPTPICYSKFHFHQYQCIPTNMQFFHTICSMMQDDIFHEISKWVNGCNKVGIFFQEYGDYMLFFQEFQYMSAASISWRSSFVKYPQMNNGGQFCKTSWPMFHLWWQYYRYASLDFGEEER